MTRIKRLRLLSFSMLCVSMLIAGPTFAEEDYQGEDEEAPCGTMAIQYGSNVSQGAATTYCQTLACGDVCASLLCSCASGCSASASGCATCNHEWASWTYRAHGTCNCTDLK